MPLDRMYGCHGETKNRLVTNSSTSTASADRKRDNRPDRANHTPNNPSSALMPMPVNNTNWLPHFGTRKKPALTDPSIAPAVFNAYAHPTIRAVRSPDGLSPRMVTGNIAPNPSVGTIINPVANKNCTSNNPSGD